MEVESLGGGQWRLQLPITLEEESQRWQLFTLPPRVEKILRVHKKSKFTNLVYKSILPKCFSKSSVAYDNGAGKAKCWQLFS